MFCQKCGHKIEKGYLVCDSCGASVSAENKTNIKTSSIGGLGITIIIIIVVITSIILAGGITFFVAAKIAADERVQKEGNATQPTVASHTQQPRELIHIGDYKQGVVVNIGGVTGRYLKIVMAVEVESTRDTSGRLIITDADKMKIQPCSYGKS